MSRPLLLAVVLTLPLPSVAAAQHDGGGAPRAASTAPREASQFAFLLGQWELTVTPKVTTLAARIHGAPKLRGSWKAWRAFDGFGIEDELRIVDRSGNPMALNHAMRVYDAARGRWNQSMLDVYRTRLTSATAEWKGSEMIVHSQGSDAEGKPTLQRGRFFAITPTSFSYQNDRSSDNGKSWETEVLRIEARRVAAVAPR